MDVSITMNVSRLWFCISVSRTDWQPQYIHNGYENKCYYPFPAPCVSTLKVSRALREPGIGKQVAIPIKTINWNVCLYMFPTAPSKQLRVGKGRCQEKGCFWSVKLWGWNERTMLHRTQWYKLLMGTPRVGKVQQMHCLLTPIHIFKILYIQIVLAMMIFANSVRPGV